MSGHTINFRLRFLASMVLLIEKVGMACLPFSTDYTRSENISDDIPYRYLNNLKLLFDIARVVLEGSVVLISGKRGLVFK